MRARSIQDTTKCVHPIKIPVTHLVTATAFFFLNHFADDDLRKCNIFRCVLAHGSVTVILCSAFRRRMKKKTSRKYQFSRFGTYLRSIVIVSAPSTRHIHLYLSLSLSFSRTHTHTHTFVIWNLCNRCTLIFTIGSAHSKPEQNTTSRSTMALNA